MRRLLVILAAIVATTPALARDCEYRQSGEYATAVETDAGFKVTYWSDGFDQGDVQAVTNCTRIPGEINATAKCDSGWNGPLIFAGANPDDITRGATMVLLDAVWFRVCK